MGVREWLNRHPATAGWGAGLLCVIVLGAAGYQFRRGSGPSGPSTLDFYSVDDGKTWFTAAAGQRSPIQTDGVAAYRVVVWKCLTDGKPFVSHLERALSAPGQGASDAQPSGRGRDVEVRKPGAGESGWVKASSERGMKVTAPLCPNGHDDVEPLEP